MFGAPLLAVMCAVLHSKLGASNFVSILFYVKCRLTANARLRYVPLMLSAEAMRGTYVRQASHASRVCLDALSLMHNQVFEILRFCVSRDCQGS